MPPDNARNWRTLRTFAAVTAESSPPLAGDAWVSVKEPAREVEVRVVIGATSGGTPTSVLLSVWRKTRDNAGNAVIDRVKTITLSNSSTDVAEGDPTVITPAVGELFYVTVGFSGGTAPTFTGTVQIRSTLGSA